MAPRRESQRIKVVIGVDFGTTFSGVAYTCPAWEQIPPRIHTINNNRKIPTRLCYCVTSRSAQDFDDSSSRLSCDSDVLEEKKKTIKCRTITGTGGHRGEGTATAVRESSYQLENSDVKLQYIWGEIKNCNNLITSFKLLLDDGVRKIAALPSLLIPLDNLVIDYIRALRELFETELFQTYPQIAKQPDDYEFDWTFTVPAFFSPEMVGNFKELLSKAGVQEPIGVMLEPAAGLYYAIWSNAMSNPQDHTYPAWRPTTSSPDSPTSGASDLLGQRGNRIVVCDAGGGTTDLEAMEIESLNYDNETQLPHIKLRPQQCTDGGKVGSIDIEHDFAADVISRLKSAKLWSGPDLNPPTLQGNIINMDEFIEMKINFSNQSIFPMFLQLFPDPPTNGWRGNYPDAGIDAGFIRLDKAQMERHFGQTLMKLKRVVDTYLRNLEEKNKDIQCILFIGGLSASPYTQRLMTTWVQSKGFMAIFPPTQEDALLAVMRGAVLARLQQLGDEGMPPTMSFLARSSFGIVLDLPYIPYKHESELVQTHEITGKQIVKDQIEWLVKKGDEIIYSKNTKRELIRQEYFLKGHQRKWTYRLVRCDEMDREKIPASTDSPEVIPVCEETLDLSSIKHHDGRCFTKLKKRSGAKTLKYYEVELRIVLEFISATELNYAIIPRTKELLSETKTWRSMFHWFWSRGYNG